MPNDVNYNHETVVVDGEAFSDCNFATCRLVYSGGELPTFDGCRFDNCEWRFEESATQTLSYLRLMWTVGAKAAVQATIKEITVVGRG